MACIDRGYYFFTMLTVRGQAINIQKSLDYATNKLPIKAAKNIKVQKIITPVMMRRALLTELSEASAINLESCGLSRGT
jgi:hypothetical protein